MNTYSHTSLPASLPTFDPWQILVFPSDYLVSLVVSYEGPCQSPFETVCQMVLPYSLPF